MIFDTHMHCEFSCDSEMTLADAVRAAKAQAIGMIVTEHWDYDYPTNPEAFLFNVDEYFANFAKWRSESVLAGIEIGMQSHTAAVDEKIAAKYPFDFVLGAIHCIGKRDLYEPSCYVGRSRAEIVMEFLAESITCLKNHHNFDAFAHIDYLCRYWPYTGANKDLRPLDNPELLDELFCLLIEGGKVLEINTRRLDDAAAADALLALCQRYQELGGRYCTVGSDAHYQQHVGRRLKQALALAEAASLRPVYFRARKPEYLEK